MLKLVLVSAALCTFLCAINAEENATNAEENATFTKEIQLSNPYSTTIVDGSHLVTLSANRTHVFVNSTDEPDKLCEIPIDRVEHPIQKKVKAAMLGDKIVVWGVRAKYQVKRRTRIDYTFIIVDPKQCSFKPVTTFEEEFLWLFDMNQNLPEVVTHDDSFDIFYATVRTCSPCRYSVDGKRVDLKQSIADEPLEPSALTHVKAFDGSELKNGYFYAHNYDGQTSVIKLFDQDFKAVKEKTFKHTIDAAAVNSGDHPTVTTCYMKSIRVNPLNDEKVNCERFDANLESVFSVDLPLLKKHDPASVSLAVDSSGDSFISVVESDEFEDIDVFRLYRLNSTSQVVKVMKLGEMPRKKFYGNWQLRGFIFDKQYCLETTKIWPNWIYKAVADEKESVKCIAI